MEIPPAPNCLTKGFFAPRGVTTNQLKWLCVWQFSNCGPVSRSLHMEYYHAPWKEDISFLLYVHVHRNTMLTQLLCVQCELLNVSSRQVWTVAVWPMQPRAVVHYCGPVDHTLFYIIVARLITLCCTLLWPGWSHSIVHYCLSTSLLQAHRVSVKHDMGTLS